jgi:hypothetical protein
MGRAQISILAGGTRPVITRQPLSGSDGQKSHKAKKRLIATFGELEIYLKYWKHMDSWISNRNKNGIFQLDGFLSSLITRHSSLVTGHFSYA